MDLRKVLRITSKTVVVGIALWQVLEWLAIWDNKRYAERRRQMIAGQS